MTSRGDMEYEIEVAIPDGASKAEEQRLIDAAIDREADRIANELLKGL